MKNNQQGRSMIEMLGVLAIIGVLSIGGIAGYSKAMQMYKTNQTLDQISRISGSIQTFYMNRKDRYAGVDNMNFLVKYKILDEDMVETGEKEPTDWSSQFPTEGVSQGVIAHFKGTYNEFLKSGNASSLCEYMTGGYGAYYWHKLDMSAADCEKNPDAAMGQWMGIPETPAPTFITTPIEAKMTISNSGSQTFTLSLTEVPQQACIEIATKDWHTASGGFLNLRVGNISTDQVMDVGSATAECQDAVNNSLVLTFK